MCRGYELMRDLDFNDPNSYLSGEINPDWIVPDFATTHTGWTPIGSEETPFAAVFEGNGHIISNLQINRDGEDFQGLFGYIGRVDALGNRSTIRNLGLEDVRIEGGTHVGAMAGDLRGSIVNSYATGSVSGVFNVGGMVGNIGFYTPLPPTPDLMRRILASSSTAIVAFSYLLTLTTAVAYLADATVARY